MHDKYSRPASLDDLKNVIRSLNAQKADYILVGGYALFSHGYHRSTEDIDLLVPASADASDAIIRALLVLHDKESANLKPAWFEEGENIRLADEVVVDLLFTTCGQTYETLKSYVETVEVDGVPVRTLNLDGLLLTKQSDREKDVLDRRILEQAIEALRNRQPPNPSV